MRMTQRARLKRQPGAAFAAAASLCTLLLAACSSGSSGDVPAKETAAPATALPATALPATALPATAAPSAQPAPAETVAASAAGGDAPPPSAQPRAAAPGGVQAPSAASAPAASAVASAAPSPSAAPIASASAAPTATADVALNVQGSKAQGDAFSVWMQSAKTYKVGQSGAVEVVVIPKGEYHCNESYPYKVKMAAAPAGVSFAQDTVRGASVSATRASIRVPFTATAAGDAKISGKFSFSVCKADQCVIDSRDVAATIKIE